MCQRALPGASLIKIIIMMFPLIFKSLCTLPDWRSCSLIQPVRQRANGVYSEALCQRRWSSEDTWAASPERRWRDPGGTDSSAKRSNHSQAGGGGLQPKKPQTHT